MFISSISHPKCSSLYLLYFNSTLKMVLILLYFYYVCHAAVKLRLCYLYLCRCTICMYRKLLANMSPFSLYVLLYIMVVRISVDFIRKKMFLTEAVFILICCCALLKFISNMQYIIIYFKMILPENEFSLLKGVNNQPYLDI